MEKYTLNIKKHMIKWSSEIFLLKALDKMELFSKYTTGYNGPPNIP